MEDSYNSRWYAVQVRPRYEKMVSGLLRHKNIEEYLPSYQARHRWSDREARLELPLFPGYLFCHLDLSHRILPVLTTPGVLRLVGTGRVPVPIDDSELEAVRALLRSGISPCPWPLPRLGERVVIEHGPLRGLEGILVAERSRCRFVVSVTLLQRAVAVEIEAGWARPVSQPKSCAPAGAGTPFASQAFPGYAPAQHLRGLA